MIVEREDPWKEFDAAIEANRKKYSAMTEIQARAISIEDWYAWVQVERERYGAEWLKQEQHEQAMKIASHPKGTKNNPAWQD